MTQQTSRAQQVGEAVLRGAERVKRYMQEHPGIDPRTAVVHLSHADRQERANMEVLRFAAQVQPADLQQLANIAAKGGRDGLISALSGVGLSPDACEVVGQTWDATGGSFDGLVGTVRGSMAAEVQASVERHLEETVQRAQEQWTPNDSDAPGTRTVKEGSPIAAVLRDPEFHRRAYEWLAPRYEALRAEGILPDAQNLSPGELFLQAILPVVREGGPGQMVDSTRAPFAARMGQDEAFKAFADVLGEDAAGVRAILEGGTHAHLTHGLLSRLAKRDDEAHAAQAKRAQASASTPAAEAPQRKGAAPRESLRETIERAAAAAPRRAERRPGQAERSSMAVGNSLQAAIARAAGHDAVPFTNDAAKQIRSDDEASGTSEASLRDTIESAVGAESGGRV